MKPCAAHAAEQRSDLSVPNGRKHLMRRSYPAAVGDTTRRSRQIFVVKKQKVQSGLILDNSGRN